MPNRTPAPKKTTTQRGYGTNHKRARTRLITRHTDGHTCTWCGQPMYKDATKNWDGAPLEAHHPDGQPTRTAAKELLHRRCNRQIGEPGTREHLRPGTTTPHHPTQTDPTLTPLVMAWP